MSIKATRTDYTLGFIFGILCLAIGTVLILYQLIIKGYIINSSAPDPYSIFAGWAALGIVSLCAGAFLIYRTYSIFVPLKQNTFTSDRACPFCGVVLQQDAVVCQKCKQQLPEN